MIVWRGDTARVGSFELIVTKPEGMSRPTYRWGLILRDADNTPTLIMRSTRYVPTEREARSGAEAAIESLARGVLEHFPPRTVHDQIAEHPFVCQGEHDCQGSISGRCWYNSKLDPNHDSCMWCGQPEERN